MDGEMKAALIGAVVAALGSAMMLCLYECWKERRDRGRIASALLVEVMAQAEFVAVLAQAVHMPGALAIKENFAKYLPPPSIVYEALAGQLPILGTGPSSCVIAFHGAISWARSLSGYLPSTIEFSEVKSGSHVAPTLPDFHAATITSQIVDQQAAGLLSKLQQATRGASLNALLAIRTLAEIATHERRPNDETDVADMLRKLENAAKLGVGST